MENNHLSEPILLTFSLVPKEVYSLPGEVERVDTDILEILIKDNDGKSSVIKFLIKSLMQCKEE